MRDTHRCPKCRHDEILHVPAPKDADRDAMAIGGQHSFLAYHPNGRLQAYACTRCGYAEFYVDLRSLDVAKIDGAQLLHAESGDPYR